MANVIEELSNAAPPPQRTGRQPRSEPESQVGYILEETSHNIHF